MRTLPVTIDLTATVAASYNLQLTTSANTQLNLSVGAAGTQLSLQPSTQIVLTVATSGSSAGSNLVTTLITAAESLEAYRAVTATGLLCDKTLADLNIYSGVTQSTVLSGVNALVVRAGILSNSAWTWVAGQAILIADNGVLTQSSQTAPLKRIGVAVSSTAIALDPQPVIGV